jgi:hypothetical protein
MTLVEILAIGYPQALSINDWGDQDLRYLAWGPDADTHVATALFDPKSLDVACLEIFDPEGVTWVWRDPRWSIDIRGTTVDTVKALSTLGYLMKHTNLAMSQEEEEDTDDPT